MSADTRLGVGIVLAVTAYFVGCAVLGVDAMALPMRIVGMAPIVLLLFLLPFGAIAVLARLLRR
jgi:hypothetical protein